MAGKFYVLENKYALTNASWAGSDTIRGDGNNRTLTNDARFATQDFYRVRRY